MFSAAVFLILLLFATPSTASDEAGPPFREHLTQADENIKENRQDEAGEALRAAAVLAETKDPFLHMRLAKHNRDQGRIAEAIAEAEKAVAMAPSATWFKYDLATLYLAGKYYNKAEDQLRTLLKLDPGFASGYSTLAGLYFSTNRHDLARLAAKRAKLLGYRGKDLDLFATSSPTSPEEALDRPADRHMLFRFIKTGSDGKATTILQEIGQGKLFEDFAQERRGESGGEAEYGIMQSGELPEKVAEPLAGVRPYGPPVIIKTGRDYRIMQRILPFDPAAWQLIADRSAGPPENKNQVAEATPKSKPPAPEQTPLAQDRATEKAAAVRQERQTPASIAALHALESWKKSWETADIDGYLAAYSKSFAPPDGLTFAAWKDKRRKSLARPRTIRIKISDTIIETLPNNLLLITFRQHYESDDYRDTVIKSLTMIKEATGWKIQSEWIVRELPR